MLNQINKLTKLNLSIVIALFLNANASGQTLKGRLLFSGLNSSTKTFAKNVIVILVPRTPQNEKIVNELFFYADNTKQLKEMNAILTSTNNEGYYFFNNIKTGKYLLKVCISYGIIYKFKITDDKYTMKLFPDMLATYNSR